MNPVEIETCQSCGITHKSVECIGIIYCPNALCMGSGGGWFRSKLASLNVIPGTADMEHTVDEEEWLRKGIEHNKAHGIKRSRFMRAKKKKKTERTLTLVVSFDDEKATEWIWDAHKEGVEKNGIRVLVIAEGNQVREDEET